MSMPVVIESPFGNADPSVVEENIRYARACVADSLRRGEAPFASHLLYTQPGILDDSDKDQRQRGIQAGLVIGDRLNCRVIVYTDRGVSEGMKQGIRHAQAKGRVIELRSLYEKDITDLRASLYPTTELPTALGEGQ